MTSEIKIQKNHLLVSKTDASGRILYANDEFCHYAGYSLIQLVGQHHNIVRHPDMPKWAFASLWETVKRKEVWEGFVKNKTKRGDFYWVFARVFPTVNRSGETEYVSVRVAIDDATRDKYHNIYQMNSKKGANK